MKNSPKHGLILLAHGSYDPDWKKPFQTLLSRIEQHQNTEHVYLAYMEMAEPNLEVVAQTAYQSGVRQLTILPLFMASGGHLRNDVPTQCEQLKTNHPDLSIELLPPIGEHPAVTEAMLTIALAIAHRGSLSHSI